MVSVGDACPAAHAGILLYEAFCNSMHTVAPFPYQQVGMLFVMAASATSFYGSERRGIGIARADHSVSHN